jgi:hypothetical protein
MYNTICTRNSINICSSRNNRQLNKCINAFLESQTPSLVIIRLLRNPVRNCCLLDLILILLSPSITSHPISSRQIIIIPSTPRSPKQSLQILRLKFWTSSSSSHACYTLCPYRPPWLYCPITVPKTTSRTHHHHHHHHHIMTLIFILLSENYCSL